MYKDLFADYFLRKLRNSVRSQLVMALSVNHVLLLIVFLSGVEATGKSGPCHLVSLLIHYFLLSTFCWMACSSYLLFFKIVVVVQVLAGNYVQGAALFSQGDSANCEMSKRITNDSFLKQ